MPASYRRVLRDIRRSYTGENKMAAKAGLGRTCLGLDRCTPAQRRFRALAALHMFNGYGPEVGHSDIYRAYSFLSYTMIASPRYGHMVFLVPSAPENAFSRLISERHDLAFGMPGLRLVTGDGTTFHAVHLPTGARATFAARADFEAEDVVRRQMRGREELWFDHYPRADLPLSPDEKSALDRVPPMTVGIETLLAALVVRVSARDPLRRWDVGNWWCDPLRRARPESGGPERRLSLWGSGRRWVLRWNGHPYPEDIVACLTANEIGVPGVVADEDANGWTVSLGGSSLHLRYGEAAR